MNFVVVICTSSLLQKEVHVVAAFISRHFRRRQKSDKILASQTVSTLDIFQQRHVHAELREDL